MLFLGQPLSLAFLYHRSGTICQIDLHKVSNPKLKPDLCNCLKTEIIESTVPPQQPYIRGTIFETSSTCVIFIDFLVVCLPTHRSDFLEIVVLQTAKSV